MSTRAYKLIEIKTEKTPSFNVSHDERITGLNCQDDNGDIILIYKDDAESLLKEIQAEMTNRDGEPTGDADELLYLSNCLKQIIKDCDGEEYCEYYCY